MFLCLVGEDRERQDVGAQGSFASHGAAAGDVGDDHVEAAEFGCCLVDERAQRRGVGDVHFPGHDDRAGLAQLSCRDFQRCPGAGADRQVGAFFSEDLTIARPIPGLLR